MNLKMEHKADYELSTQEKRDLQNILQKGFPGYFEDRLYHKQVPKFRVLAKDNEVIVGQVGIEYRAIRSRKHGVLHIIGLIDTCVDEKYRNRGIATELLLHLEHWAKGKAIDAFVAFADDHRLYTKQGYTAPLVTCRLLAIEAHESVQVMEKMMENCFMIKFLKDSLDMQGDHVDMLGYVF